MGVFSLVGLTLGYWSLGSVGVGWLSFSAGAIAWKAASGGVALAHDYATGGYAEALEANTAAAKQFIMAQPFFRAGFAILPYLTFLNLVWVLPLFKWWRTTKKNKAAASHA